MEKNVLPELMWNTKQRSANNGNADVSVSIVKNGGDRRRLNFSFKNDIDQLFGGDYVVFALMKNRIYFKASNSIEGYKLSKAKNRAYVAATLNGSQVDEYKKFIGDFDLKFDVFYELYYIERNMDIEA